MLKLITHVHTLYSTDGWHNPDSVLRFAKKNDVIVELLAHNNIVWSRLYPEVCKSDRIVRAIEFGFKNTDVIAAGENLDEFARFFPIYDHRVKRMLDTPLEEGIEVLEKNADYIYFPHPTFFSGVAKSGYESLLSKVDAIEVWNASISLIPFYNWRALRLAEKLNKTKLAGLDGHLGSLKSCYNLVYASCREEVYEAIRKGKVEPHINSTYPIHSARDYAVLTFLAVKDILKSNLKISLSDFTSLTKQLYSV